MDSRMSLGWTVRLSKTFDKALRMSQRTSRSLLLLPALTLALAPTAGISQRPSTLENLRQEVREAGLDPDEVILPTTLSPQMREWLGENISRNEPGLGRLRTLLSALQDSSKLDLQYEAGYTGTAQEVFDSRRFNCLSFSHLIVGMARELNIPAYFMNVEEIQTYTRDGDLVVVAGHVTAGFGSGPNREVLEFNLGPEVNYRTARRMSDLEALAMFYSNRGAELLRAGQAQEAREWLEVATKLLPEFADGWVNLGVVLRRLGDLEGADRAYRKAAEIDPGMLSAYRNLATLFEIQGQKHAARELLRVLDRRGNRDPFIYLALGDNSLQAGRLDEARRFYRKALRLSDEPADAQAAMGLWAETSGELALARKWLRRAQATDAENSRVLRLERALTRREEGVESGG